MGSDEDDDGQNEREQTPTLTSMTSGPPHLTRSNSLGLGFSDREDPIPTVGGAESNASQPAMYIASSTNAPVVSSKSVPSSDDLVKIEKSPAGSIGSSALEEDDRIFDEAKEAL